MSGLSLWAAFNVRPHSCIPVAQPITPRRRRCTPRLGVKAIQHPRHIPKDRRRSPRYACHGPIEFRIQNWYSRKGRILDLCLDGCLIQPRESSDYVIGDQLEMRFEVNHLSFRVHCIVRQVRPSGHLGVEILCLSDRSRAQLRELIDELSRTRSEPLASLCQPSR